MPPTNSAAYQNQTHTPFAKNDPHCFFPLSVASSPDGWGPAWETMWYGWEKHDCSFFPITYSCKLAQTRENCNSRGFWRPNWPLLYREKKEYHLKKLFLVSLGHKIYGGFAEPRQNSKVNSCKLSEEGYSDLSTPPNCKTQNAVSVMWLNYEWMLLFPKSRHCWSIN